jgi:shikimate kinase
MKAIILRGPLGIGKTTISLALAKQLEAEYFSIDKAIEEYGLDRKDSNFVPEDFIKANNFILPKAKDFLGKGKSVIFDGNFYFLEQIEHLIENIEEKVYIFDLKADLETCIKRDKERQKAYGEQAAKDVHELVSRFNYGIQINTQGKTKEEVLNEILAQLKC